jgi:nucleotide-binding universal stress UspA family protein
MKGPYTMEKRIRRILYATDYSKASSRALDQAVQLAKQNDAELLVVHVIEPVTPYVTGDDYGSTELYLRLEETTKNDAQSSMQKLMQKLQKLKVNAKSLLLRGSTHDQIIKAAKSRKADMIVIGTHGRTGLSKLFMGSVASKVVSTAHCPVLTVRGK